MQSETGSAEPGVKHSPGAENNTGPRNRRQRKTNNLRRENTRGSGRGGRKAAGSPRLRPPLHNAAPGGGGRPAAAARTAAGTGAPRRCGARGCWRCAGSRPCKRGVTPEPPPSASPPWGAARRPQTPQLHGGARAGAARRGDASPAPGCAAAYRCPGGLCSAPARRAGAGRMLSESPRHGAVSLELAAAPQRCCRGSRVPRSRGCRRC